MHELGVVFHIADTLARIAPTERSISPVMMIMPMPREITPTTAE